MIYFFSLFLRHSNSLYTFDEENDYLLFQDRIIKWRDNSSVKFEYNMLIWVDLTFVFLKTGEETVVLI